MRKREQQKKPDNHMRNLVIRNWILAAVSLGLAVFVYAYFGN